MGRKKYAQICRIEPEYVQVPAAFLELLRQGLLLALKEQGLLNEPELRQALALAETKGGRT